MGLVDIVKGKVSKAADKVANGIAKCSSLSSKQVEEVQQLRENYLLEMAKHDPNDPAAQEFSARFIAASGVEIFNAYLPQIAELYTPIANEDSFQVNKNVQYINITKWVTDKKENALEKLVNVYAVLSNEPCNIGLVFHRTKKTCEVYIAVANIGRKDGEFNKKNDYTVKSYIKRLNSAIKGNFPGSETSYNEEDDKEAASKGVPSCLTNSEDVSIATISNIPTEKSEKFISQTIEKLLDGIVPTKDKEDEEYTVLLLASPINDVESRKNRLGQIYSGLYPYSSWQTNFTLTDSEAKNSMVNLGVHAGLNGGINQGTNHSNTVSDSIAESISESKTKSPGAVGGGVGAGAGAAIGAVLGTFVFPGPGTGIGIALGSALGGGLGSITNAFVSTKTKGKTTTKTHTEGTTDGVYKGVNLGANFGVNFARSSSVTATIGKNEGITQNFTNYNIKHGLELLEEQMKRYEQSTALGMWDFAAYVLSKDSNVANNVAHSYLALTQGEKSYMSQSAINLWYGNLTEDSKNETAKTIVSYVSELRHPVFGLDPKLSKKIPFFNVYPPFITATTPLSGKELAYSLNFPAKSIPGLPVLESAAFGRNQSEYKIDNSYKQSDEKNKINLGNIVHMYHEDKSIPVNLDMDSLCSHTFITGSTGSGKSNTVYQLIQEIKNKGKTFLVIEPAKGEYKHVFGNMDDVEVYGTNPNLSKLLKINPFSFPNEYEGFNKENSIHILEHLDRLVEIFNVCWPMYAAMPAVLKEAIEKSYEDAGWNLTNSTNPNGAEYPTFADIAQNIKIIIDTSEYDAENKGAYKGSLLTRLKSLTNGLNGQIFTAKNTISDADLFDENVIIDLSRVGSQETKSLLMGILVLKLQEYRMAKSDMNAELKHITVLEEAHNLLKRTSTEQSAESANLAGKSVEMLTNAIAEMRTYGEGFIIADQAPALLDMAVIRNTNTKIIMRLPDLSDRELVGKAANLNDDQIIELAKLPCGVAAVYQNEWVEAVLCKIKDFYSGLSDAEKKKKKAERYNCPNDESDDNETSSIDLSIRIARLLSKGEQLSKADSKKELDSVNINYVAKGIAMEYLQNPPTEPRMTKLAPVMAALFPKAYTATKNTYAVNQDNPALWTNDIVDALNKEQYWIDKQNMDQVQRDIVQALITQYVFNEIHQAAKLEEWTKHHGF